MAKKINNFNILLGFAAVMAVVTTSIAAYAANENKVQQIAEMNQALPEYSTYVSKDGWKTQYEKNSFEVNETRDGAYFVYTGDCAGTCYVGMSVISGKSPREVLGEKTADWNPDDMVVSEGFFNGDKWAYNRRLSPVAGAVPVYQMCEAAEYNGNVFLVEVYQTMGNDSDMNSTTSDMLSMVLDSLQFDYYNPQTEFDYYVGEYEHKYEDVIGGQVQTFTDTITLNPDHTGKLSMQDDVDFYWGSYQLFMNPTWTEQMEFSIEGDDLYVNMGDNNWVCFTRVEAEDLE